MATARGADVIIRNGAAEGTYLIVDARTRLALGEPYASFAEAVTAAKRLAGRGTVWREILDGRGRLLGAPVRIEPV